MKKFDANIQESSYVCIKGSWHMVKSVTANRLFLKVYGLSGLCKPSQISESTNNNLDKRLW